LREEKGLSQQELSDLSGIARDRISMIETGIISCPLEAWKEKLARALGVEIDKIF
jgi:transcriptional regulator with XRE-family HTH domain